METQQGQDLGHPPEGYSWATYVDLMAEECGSLSALAEQFVDRISESEFPNCDPETARKGIHRLKRRKGDGGKYGRNLLQHFDVPPVLETWIKPLGQHHSRFTDLPVPYRHDHLTLWNRPPVANTVLHVWLKLGLANVSISNESYEAAAGILDDTWSEIRGAGGSAHIEALLVRSYLASVSNDLEWESQLLRRAKNLLVKEQLTSSDSLCYSARLADQRAYRLLHPLSDLDEATRIYSEIPKNSGIPFVDMKRELGRAYCKWKVGDKTEAAKLARLACRHAGDGGYVRMRVIALNLLKFLVSESEAGALRVRAAKLAQQLGDEDLKNRLRS